MKNNSAILGMIFGSGIGIIFGSTGLGLPMGACIGYIIGLLLDKQYKKTQMSEKQILAIGIGTALGSSLGVTFGVVFITTFFSATFCG